MIKWSKLYLDDFQSSWTMPQRDKGFIQHGYICTTPNVTERTTSKIKMLSHDVNEAIYQAFKYLNIKEENQQAYVESHLLSLPGWAGMMYYRAEKMNLKKTYLLNM